MQGLLLTPFPIVNNLLKLLSILRSTSNEYIDTSCFSPFLICTTSPPVFSHKLITFFLFLSHLPTVAFPPGLSITTHWTNFSLECRLHHSSSLALMFSIQAMGRRRINTFRSADNTLPPPPKKKFYPRLLLHLCSSTLSYQISLPVILHPESVETFWEPSRLNLSR